MQPLAVMLVPWAPSSCFSALPAAIPRKTRQPHAESVHSGPGASGLLHGHVRCRLRAGYAQAACALLKRPGRPSYGKAACCTCLLQPTGPVKAQGGPLLVPWQPPGLNLPYKGPTATNVQKKCKRATHSSNTTKSCKSAEKVQKHGQSAKIC